MKPCTLATDDTLRETTQHGSNSFPLAYYLEDVWESDFHCIDWHWHHELEFLSVTEGSLSCLIGTEQIELPKGWGMFINSGVLHRFEAKAHTLIPNIVFLLPCYLPRKVCSMINIYSLYCFTPLSARFLTPKTDGRIRFSQFCKIFMLYRNLPPKKN